MPSPKPRRRRGLLVALTVVVVLLLAGGAAAFVLLREPGDVSNPDVAFTATETTEAEQPPPPPKPTRRRLAVDTFSWPTYGLNDARTRDWSSAPDYLRPRFRRGWTYRGTALLEFPPVIRGATLFLLDDDGWLRAINKVTGGIRWRVHFGRLAAASPAIGDGHVYVVALESRTGSGGRVGAFREVDGRGVWTRELPSRAESSPLLLGRSLFFGTEDGTLYALDAKTGHTRWTYKASGAIKGSPAYANGTLYFGDYGGRVHAVRARDGRQVWSVGTSGTRFGFGSGRFYSTPAVAFGRVYLGNTDSRVYSFSAKDGKLAWATGTGGYVYAAPSVSNVRGLGPTVYAGSYDGNFYAFDARSGAKRWATGVGNRISGSSTIIGDVVYFSNLGSNDTHGLDVRTGRRVFFFPEGSFTPVVADRRAIYLVGYANMFEMLPTRTPPAWRRAQRAAKRAARLEYESAQAFARRARARKAAARRAARRAEQRRAAQRRAAARRAARRSAERRAAARRAARRSGDQR
ncbi:PQQ-binding-like beta-propeller repeat protein [Conexibacter arvalis]|uniref:Outer membrane protein assembly factor BamB n=1 Tax=Conexibacter arvalis TaxID=912552 RepID=A0A840II83_9ACTN|nr:PQQ-binding-like beta-propeller repeat protein [Conexibacter arvalis]MBB4663658.1 outer membrane protein assembly factor BamB [Conexibacter arvalis]